jgi:hypothetical protein
LLDLQSVKLSQGRQQLFDELVLIAGYEGQVSDADFAQPLQVAFQQRFPGELQKNLGSVTAGGLQSHSHSGGVDDGLHKVYF